MPHGVDIDERSAVTLEILTADPPISFDGATAAARIISESPGLARP